MGQVNILVIVNVSEAISTGKLADYVWMVDTNDYLATGNKSEGTNELNTHVANGDTIVWTVVPIDPNDKVSINKFTTQFGKEGAIPWVVDPAAYPGFGKTVWGGRVRKIANGAQYSMELLLGGKHLMHFDPFITSVNE